MSTVQTSLEVALYAEDTEVSCMSYSRASVFKQTGDLSNSERVIFPEPKEDWGTITSVGLVDNIGNIKRLNLAVPKLVRAGDPALGFPIGALPISL